MKKIFVNTKNKAIKLAKEILRNKNNVKRLSYTNVKESSCQCNCGETFAVRVFAKIGEIYPEITIGVCNACTDIQEKQ